jgi:ABC-type transport system involved in multi-copper enzyme maturation permease subunit
MISLFLFTIRQNLLQRKIWLTILLLLFPTVLALVVRYLAEDRTLRDLWQMYHVLMQFLMFTMLMPLVCVLYGTALIGAEVEQRTLIYLTTRKLRRATVLLVRFAGTWLVLTVLFALALLLLHVCVTTGLGLADAAFWKPALELRAYLMIAPAGVAGFLAVFTTISLVFARPLIISAIYMVTFEMMLANAPILACRLSITHPLRRTLLTWIPNVRELYDLPRDMQDLIYPPGVPGTWTVLCIIGALLLIAGTLVSVRELVPAKVSRD